VSTPFPDAEDVVMAILEPLAPGRVVQSTPAEWTPPLIRVHQTGGTSDRFNDRPVVTVETFGVDYPAAKDLAKAARQLILAARGTGVRNVAGHFRPVLVDRAEDAATPREVGYDDPDKRRKTASYRLTMRRPRA